MRSFHQPNEAIHEVIDIAERAGLTTIPVDSNIMGAERLNDKIRNDAPVIWMHARAVGVKNPRYLDGQMVLAAVVEKQGFCATLAFIIARTRANGIDVTPILFCLRMHRRVPIDFWGRRLQGLGLHPFCEGTHVEWA